NRRSGFMKNKKKIMAVAGGSGGHIFPAAAFCLDIQRNYQNRAECILVTNIGSKSNATSSLIPDSLTCVDLKASKTPSGIWALAIRSLSVFLRFSPDVIVGFGGFCTVPLILLARLCGRKAFIHEQNVMPGRANRFLSAFAHKIFISFSGTQPYVQRFIRKVTLVSFPLRSSMVKMDKATALHFFGLNENFFTVLIIGGSQGSHVLNEKISEAVKQSPQADRFQLIHICGPSDEETLKGAYRQAGVRSKVFAFLNEMHYAYSAADLVISRAGAGAVMEITRLGLPAILVPYPYAGGHQKENAKFLAQKGAALLLEESQLTPVLLNGLLAIFIDDAMRRKTMSSLAVALFETMGKTSLSEAVLS
ncbi:MAG: UDP-N-acetylglucosamine--N-acetylmuramyl-(pentapeptide) pyrophosphoryl-undecaprenol N-acetylglucosamine transferase, partial [Candidatus Omnitrophota bacterium]